MVQDKNLDLREQGQKSLQKNQKRSTSEIPKKSKCKVERAKNQGVTNLPPLGKSHPRDSVAQETSKDMRISENLLFPRWLPPRYDDSKAPYKTLSLCCGWFSPSHPIF